ncbi:MAG TPA: DNA alkylation repair protein [Patescibacteria group bacterium]|nr:DNA alkylation repair protein [Patescibacteria group bacterium]
MTKLDQLKKELSDLTNAKQAKLLQGFFRTGPGQYGEGDIFLGIKVPAQRGVAKKYPDLNLSDIQKLLNSKIHEHRLIALFILIAQYKNLKNESRVSATSSKTGLPRRLEAPRNDKVEHRLKQIFDFYLKNYKNINNWDLVDLSAPNIAGDYLLNQPRDILYKLAKSDHLWQKRIAVLATFAFIKYNDFKDTLNIAKILLHDKHDLIHKAMGWMLREIGKRDQAIEEKFLKKHYQQMPRTMLRYAIEKFDEPKRQFYLKK